ncbi:Heterokaryon incompatibility protein 6, OR allele [Colletotrichum siamense]|uniref:Heterokaryon incompatibility protein 6, OR allele n=1 Tax=Colletotrichum siamense TaxID=690259 RepID=UPI00187311EE|nr:Heterokaryon incompatibility protein 6, OR allele [Colletotrichum siamense]KAF5497514.1 Heterokaryon incompatibility protein 6, OR allele [Colletotrichum siamense]
MNHTRGMFEASRYVPHLEDIYYSLPIAIDQFRILSVRPASSTTSPIIADLIVENFKNQHKHYDALSYTWGGFSNSDRIIVNGKEFPVTQNLRLAIQNLRHPSRATRLWIDCICINQADTIERNSQVQLMGWIYSQAHHVVIWLGDTSETSRVAMKLLNDCHDLESDEEIIQRVISDEVGGRALTELLQRPYWTRMWIFQEVILSRSTTVYCGPLTTTWGALRRLDKITGSPWLWPGLEIRQGWILALRRAFFGITQFFMDRVDARDMTNVLQPTRNLKATDPRDKLFALLGVCNTGLFPSPDYSKPVRDVYIDFTRTLIGHDHD